MEILWSHGEATAEQIRDLLPDRPHDSTVRTLLRILESKGYVIRQGPGRPLLYKAVVSRSKAQRTALQRLLGRLFGGSPEALALRLLEDRHLTPAQFEEIARNASNPLIRVPTRPSSSSRKPSQTPPGRPRRRRPEMIADWFAMLQTDRPVVGPGRRCDREGHAPLPPRHGDPRHPRPKACPDPLGALECGPARLDPATGRDARLSRDSASPACRLRKVRQAPATHRPERIRRTRPIAARPTSHAFRRRPS